MIEHDERLPHGVHNRFRKCTGVLQFGKLFSEQQHGQPRTFVRRPHGNAAGRRAAATRPAGTRLGPRPCERLYKIAHFFGWWTSSLFWVVDIASMAANDSTNIGVDNLKSVHF